MTYELNFNCAVARMRLFNRSLRTLGYGQSYENYIEKLEMEMGREVHIALYYFFNFYFSPLHLF